LFVAFVLDKGMVGPFPLTGTADITSIVSALTKAKWSEPGLSIVSDIPCPCVSAWGSWHVYFYRSVLVLWLRFVEAVIFFVLLNVLPSLW